MALMTLEKNWKAALTSILKELTESQFNKLLFKLDIIPQGLKSGKAREDMPHIIVQYYGTEESISVIDKEMKLLPRNDAAVQQHLRPFVDKLKKQHEAKGKKKSKAAADSGPGAKKPKPAAGMMSQAAAGGSGSVVKNPIPAAGMMSKVAADSGPVAWKPIPVAGMMSQVAADSGPGAWKLIPVVDQVKSCQPDMTIPVGAVKPQQTAGPSKTKVQSAEVYTGRIAIIQIETYNKTNIHLVVRFNDKLKTVFVTTRLLADAFGFKVEDNFIERFKYEMPFTATATVVGKKIIQIEKL